MARFTGTVGDPNVRAAETAKRGVVTQAVADPTAGIATNLLSTASSALTSRQAKGKALESGRAVEESINDLSGLQDERAGLILRQEELDRSRANINTSDGISEDEAAQLKNLQGEIDVLTQARRTGVLNDNVFGIRKRALQTAAMARVDNLGIQSQIAGIFSAGRGNIAVQADPQQQAITDSLDAQYGKDNWTEDQRGAYLDKKQHVGRMTSLGAAEILQSTDQVSTLVNNLITEEVTTLQQQAVSVIDPKTGLKTPTGFYTEEQRATFTAGISGKLNLMRRGVQQKFAEAKARGEILPQGEMDAVFNRINEAEQYLTVTVFDLGYLKGRSQQNVLTNYNKLMDESFKAKWGGISTATASQLALSEAGNLDTLIRQANNPTYIAALAAQLEQDPSVVRGKLQNRIAVIGAGLGITDQASGFGIPKNIDTAIQMSLSVNQSLPRDEDTREVHMQNYSEGTVISNEVLTKDVPDSIKAGVRASQNIMRSPHKSAKDVNDVVVAHQTNAFNLIRRFEELGGSVFIRDGELVTDDGRTEAQTTALAEGTGRARAAVTAAFEFRTLRRALVTQFTYGKVLQEGGHIDLVKLYGEQAKEEAAPVSEPTQEPAESLNQLTLEDFEKMSARQRTETLRKVGLIAPEGE